MINDTRPVDSGTDEDRLNAAWSALGTAHNQLLIAHGRHEPFLPDAIIQSLETIGRIVRLELSYISHHPHFEGDWWEDGERRRDEFEAMLSLFRQQVRDRAAELRVSATTEADQ